MSLQPLRNYISPLIVPVPPRDCGTLVLGLDIQGILDHSAIARAEATLTLNIALVVAGADVMRNERTIRVRHGKADLPMFSEEFASDALGYLEIAISSSEPLFTRLHVEPGYAIIHARENEWLTIIYDAKYARPLIIESVKTTAKFCAVHAAAHVDRAKGRGNSYLIVNPYGRDIVAQIVSASRKTIKQKVPSRHAVLVSLEPVIGQTGWECIMVTGNNRFPIWDVRHAYDDPWRIFSIDHLDMFRGGATHHGLGPVQYVRNTARTALRELGIRLS
jgi:hypothetical protein